MVLGTLCTIGRAQSRQWSPTCQLVAAEEAAGDSIASPEVESATRSSGAKLPKGPAMKARLPPLLLAAISIEPPSCGQTLAVGHSSLAWRPTSVPSVITPAELNVRRPRARRRGKARSYSTLERDRIHGSDTDAYVAIERLIQAAQNEAGLRWIGLSDEPRIAPEERVMSMSPRTLSSCSRVIDVMKEPSFDTALYGGLTMPVSIAA